MKELTGEYALLASVLELAFRDWLSDEPLQDDVMPAEFYLFEDERIEPFTFKWICQHLFLDYKLVRQNLKDYAKLHKESFQENKQFYTSNRSVGDYVVKRYIYETPGGMEQGVYIC